LNLSRLSQSLRKHEGVRALPYVDSEGHATVGVGHKLTEPLPDSVIDLLLRADIDKAIAELDRAFFGWTVHNAARQEVLAELSFNLGAPRLAGFIKFWKALDRRDYNAAADELLDSLWAKQVKGRAITLAEQMRTGECA
jgi:lysozyme